MGIRRKARELALQALYQGDLTGTSALETLPILCDNFEVNRKALPYGRQVVTGVVEHGPEIDAAIQQSAAHWRLARMSAIDRNIMRIAVYELHYCPDVPAGVAIDEAIELAKRYGTDDSSVFINGILDAIRKQ